MATAFTSEKKLPIDHRRGRPVFIRRNGKKEVAVSNGLGDAYDCKNKLYVNHEDYIAPENFIDPSTYEYERGLSGFDF